MKGNGIRQATARVERPRSSRPVLAVLAALAVALLTAGCVSMPSGGPVLSYPVTQGPDGQNQANVQIVPQPPGAGWSPSDIVQGFLTASASFGAHGHQVALQYLTPQEQKLWNPSWSAIVYKKAPTVSAPSYSSSSPPVKNQATPTAKNQATPAAKSQATVTITGAVQATLTGSYGSYSVSSPSAPGESADPKPQFLLVKEANGQWRIDDAPPEYLLTSDSFTNDYQLRSLYFFDPLTKVLVPDPVYVPVQANLPDLMNGLVHDLIAPPNDWLSGGATKTAFPPRTTISSVTLDGVTAIVDLGGAIGKVSSATVTEVMQQVSAQLLWTLANPTPSGSSGQAVQSVEVEVNGKPWVPPNGQGNPVLQYQNIGYNPSSGASRMFYYVSSTGYLTSSTGTAGKTNRIVHVGTQYSQIAVSPDGSYLAALDRSGNLYTGLVGGQLAKRGAGYQAISWNASDDLWASTGDQIVLFRGSARSRQPLAQMTPIDVVSSYGVHNMPGPFTGLRVAPDGVRVAIFIGGTEMSFGAFSPQHGTLTLSPVLVNAPLGSTFNALTWYGADDVIAVSLGTGGSTVNEYPVSGGAPVPIPADSDMRTITASSGQPLVAELPQGRLAADESLQGSWMNVDNGTSPAYPG